MGSKSKTNLLPEEVCKPSVESKIGFPERERESQPEGKKPEPEAEAENDIRKRGKSCRTKLTEKLKKKRRGGGGGKEEEREEKRIKR